MKADAANPGYDRTLVSRIRIAAGAGLSSAERRQARWRMRLGRPALGAREARYTAALADERAALSSPSATTVLAFYFLSVGVLALILGVAEFGYEGDPVLGVVGVIASPICGGVAFFLPWQRENVRRVREINAELLRDQPPIRPIDLPPWTPPSRRRRAFVWVTRLYLVAYVAVTLAYDGRQGGWPTVVVLALGAGLAGLCAASIVSSRRRTRDLWIEAERAEREYREAYPDDAEH